MALCGQMQRKMAKKRRRQKPAANFSEWATTIMLNILSALISAALIKLLGLNQSSRVGVGVRPGSHTHIIPQNQIKTRRMDREFERMYFVYYYFLHGTHDSACDF